MVAASPPPPPGPPPQNGAAVSETPSSSEQSHPTSVKSSNDAGINETSKKTYLSLLPPAQIIEICLLFEPYVPQHVKSTVWPADLEATILELQKASKPPPPLQPQLAVENVAYDTHSSSSNGGSSEPRVGTPSHQVHPPGENAPPPVGADPPMGSLRDPAEEARDKAGTLDSGATTASPSPAPQPSGGDSANPATHAQLPSQSQPGPSLPTPAFSSTPAPHASTTPQPQPQPQHAGLHPPGAYPYAHYHYALPQPHSQQSAYPHAPYYASPAAYPSHYSYPPYAHSSGYPAPPPAHSPQPTHTHGQHSLLNSNPLVRPPIHPAGPVAQPPPPPAEDLPSYEEMIVEALLDCGDSEGAAPKDLFTWMAARYPLQTNFRPSASQALQKAYKRGRLEKRTGGKYRLNPAWEGGATSKRTTRRPQTLAQTTYAMHHGPSQPSSPFTHAPLQQHSHSPAPGAQTPYNGYPYPYPYGHYPGYPQQPSAVQAAQTKTASQPPTAPPITAQPSESSTKQTEEKDESGEGSDAWQAAQHILQAINFGSLELQAHVAPPASAPSHSAAPAEQPPQGSSSSGGAASEVAPPLVAASDADLSAVLDALVSAAGAVAQPAEPPRASLTEDERAALQAQLALLAAQLTEIAEGEEEEPASPLAQPVQPAQHIANPQPVHPPQPAPAAAPPPPPPSSAQKSQQAQPAPPPPADHPPPPISAYVGGSHLVMDVNAFPEMFPSSTAASIPATATYTAGPANEEPPAPASGTEVDELADDDSDDDDMEDVVVPLNPHSHPVPATHSGHDAVRT